MSELSFLDWYPRGRLALLASKQSKDLKSCIEFTDSICSALLIFIKVKAELQANLDPWKFSEINDDFPSFKLPSAFYISPEFQDLPSSQVPGASMSSLLFTDYVRRFSIELFSDLVQHSIFQKSMEYIPELSGLSGAPLLIFDRAIYAIDVGNVDHLVIESTFPPAQFISDFGVEEHSGQVIFSNSTGATSSLIWRNGENEIFPVMATYPYVSKFCDKNKNAIHEFFNSNITSLLRLLETQTLIIKCSSNYFMSGLESSVHLLKNRKMPSEFAAGGIYS